MSDQNKKSTQFTDADALYFHKKNGKPGKVSVLPTKPLLTQRDLSLAYSPGVAVPCLEIEKDPEASYEYTARGNYVAVISNGTAVLGLGNLGALASKPVMEGKAVLFKRFADIDSIDLEVDTEDTDAFVNAVKHLGPSWGGINLEDIKAPDCFIIEEKLREVMDIPIFHDDQHGTAIITAAGLISALDVSGRKIDEVTVVSNGAGAASIACIELIKKMGVKHENVILCDRQGVIYEGRQEGMNQWKSKHAIKTDKRTLADAMEGADVFLGLSVKDAVSKDMVKSMADQPIVFAMANPDPEIRPEDVLEVRPDAIVATGRSDYPNQVNNVMGFPYIFRGALDVRATEINDEMKIAAANALAELAREHVPDEVSAAYAGRKMQYGPSYIIPAPFDPRLIYTIPPAVAQAAMDSGVAKHPIKDMEAYKRELKARLDVTANNMNFIFDRIHGNPKDVVFAEGEEEKSIRAAALWRDEGYGIPKLVGREKQILNKMKEISIDPKGIEIHNAAITGRNEAYIEFLYEKLQRQGYLKRDVIRMVKNDRNIFASCMVSCGDGDALITGLTRDYYDTLRDVRKVIDQSEDSAVFGMSIMMAQGKTVFIADTTVNESPSSADLAKITARTAQAAHHMGHTPRVALLSASSFGNLDTGRTKKMREVANILDQMQVDFEYDGEIAADVALNSELLELYPFCRLSGPANVLVMPTLDAASTSSKLLQSLGDGTLIGPLLLGLEKPVQIVQMGASVSEILNMAAFAAIDAIKRAE